jgi:hypothetical protein
MIDSRTDLIVKKAKKSIQKNFIPEIDFLKEIYLDETEIPKDSKISTFFMKVQLSEFITFYFTLLCKNYL